MRGFLRSLFSPRTDASEEIAVIRQHEREFGALDEHGLRAAFRSSKNLLEAIAIVCVVASRVLQLEMFDVQLQGALGLARGRIVEMQTGEGKTLACTPAVAWLARGGRGVHVMTVNDYLARRDARWMGGIYEYPRAYRGLRPADHGARSAPRGVRLRHHLRHSQRDRLRLSARPDGAARGRPGASRRSTPP